MTVAKKKYFPIKTETSCRLKWSWSTLYLNSGLTGSCHKASFSNLDANNFSNFHNTPEKIRDRKVMLDGHWPGHGCESCRDVELVGGYSERNFQLTVPDVYPQELDEDLTQAHVDPVVLEVFFNNTCNLACIYCKPFLSSKIESEDKKFGTSLAHWANDNEYNTNQYKNLEPLFWEWIETGYKKLQRIQVLGGEPFYQDSFFKLLDFFETHPNPNLEFNIVSNLMVKESLLTSTIDRVKKLVATNKIKRFEILASIDCWGPAAEYIRSGLDCNKFDKNIKYILEQKFITTGISATISNLSINSMPDLVKKLVEWNSIRSIPLYTLLVMPEDQHVLSPGFFEYKIFKTALEETSSQLKKLYTDDQQSQKVFFGIIENLKKMNKKNTEKQKELITYLKEIDYRRNSNWEITFPWLKEHTENVV